MYKARGILSRSSRISDKLKSFINPKFPRVIFLEFDSFVIKSRNFMKVKF